MSVLGYLWPDACPRCDARMSVLDRILLQFRRLATVASWVGKGAGPQNRDLRKCNWCHQSTGAPKISR